MTETGPCGQLAGRDGRDRRLDHRSARARSVDGLPRRSAFVRGGAGEGRARKPQVVAANVDFVFVVQALNNGPNLRRLERELVLAFESGAAPIVVLSKADLVESADVEAGVAARAHGGGRPRCRGHQRDHRCGSRTAPRACARRPHGRAHRCVGCRQVAARERARSGVRSQVGRRRARERSARSAHHDRTRAGRAAGWGMARRHAGHAFGRVVGGRRGTEPGVLRHRSARGSVPIQELLARSGARLRDPRRDRKRRARPGALRALPKLDRELDDNARRSWRALAGQPGGSSRRGRRCARARAAGAVRAGGTDDRRGRRATRRRPSGTVRPRGRPARRHLRRRSATPRCRPRALRAPTDRERRCPAFASTTSPCNITAQSAENSSRTL